MRKRYPKRLLPKPKYCLMGIMPVSFFGKFFLVRLNYTKSRLKSHEAILENKDDIFPASHFRSGGLSTILLSRFKKKDSVFFPNFKTGKYKYDAPWEPPRLPFRPIRDDVKYIKRKGFVGLNIGVIYSKKRKMEVKKGKVSLGYHYITMKVEHRPTMCNFWHCEIVLWAEHIPDEKNKERYKKRLLEITSKGVTESIGSTMLEMLEDSFLLEDETKEYSTPKHFYVSDRKVKSPLAFEGEKA